MKYAIITVINGSYKVEVESNDLNQVNVNFHSKCTTLWNAQDVSQAFVAIVDQRLSILKSEYIEHSAEPVEAAE